MRCSRQWRNLMNLKRTGMVHDQEGERHPGDLALFCVTCPQPGRNVSVEEVKASNDPWVVIFQAVTIPWPEFRKLYRPQVVADGSFKLDNLKIRNPEDDVRLADGEMFCVGSVQYEEHVRIRPERKQVILIPFLWQGRNTNLRSVLVAV
jgi:hypothetical protein